MRTEAALALATCSPSSNSLTVNGTLSEFNVTVTTSVSSAAQWERPVEFPSAIFLNRAESA